MVYSGGSKKGGGWPPRVAYAKGPRPEKVKYPGMRGLVLSSGYIGIALNYISALML